MDTELKPTVIEAATPVLPSVAEEAWQVLTARALQLAGIDTFDVISLGPEPVGIRDLTFSSLLKNCNGPSLFLRQIFDRMIQRINQLDEINKLRSIYICRNDSKMRPMPNEDALVRRLAILKAAASTALRMACSVPE